jgi:hypothetical protein
VFRYFKFPPHRTTKKQKTSPPKKASPVPRPGRDPFHNIWVAGANSGAPGNRSIRQQPNKKKKNKIIIIMKMGKN